MDDSRGYTLDNAGNMPQTNWANPDASVAHSQRFAFNTLGRLQHLIETRNGEDVSTLRGYDANGNRTSDAGGSHTYTPHTNRPASVAGQAVSVDAAGNVTQLRNLGFVWNQAGYLAEVRQGTPAGPLLATYDYDHKGRRARKSTTAAAPQGATTTLYLYDHADRLLVEADGAGNPRITYVWREDTPIALIRHGTPETVLYLETDHLNTPRAARNQAGQVVWRWESDAFGSTAANEDPAGTGTSTTVNLRFPGQYFDKESGLFYNWNRYYDPTIGRYISPDPIGLDGGLNLFGYANQNPLRYSDPTGEAATLSWCLGGPIACAAGVGSLILMSPPGQKTLKSAGKAIADLCNGNDDDDKPDCRKASKWDLVQAGILDEHAYKRENGAVPESRYDICKCKDGTIRIAAVGMCGKTSDFWH
ncbi:RHS repeat domain-containing protein [Thauera sinica]|uniref:RHS repeat domain-containing protein n=1 Tax=Thauera sp. K11 TaxID=2005884 RepID=UPI000BBB0AD6|nr:RHS repeat-associated core domain-containing protein [Thauera sp. K11]ATE59509.1 hypothetical protein CCZ27_05680 [Thauera sp. K11]